MTGANPGQVVDVQTEPGARRSTPPPSTRSRLPFRWLVGLEVGLAAVLCTLFAWSRDLWLDETASAALARASWSDFWDVISEREPNASLYYLLLRGWSELGTSELWLRLLSVLFVLGALVLLIQVTREIRGDTAALIAGLVFAVNPLFVHYGQEARGYALMMLLTSASALVLVRASRAGDRALLWFGFAGLAALAAYVSFWTVFVTAGQLLALAFLPPRDVPWRRVIQATVLWAVAIVPIGLYVRANRAGIAELARNAPGRLILDVRDIVPRGVGALVVLVAVLAAAWLLVRLHRNGPLPGVLGDWPLMFSFCWLLVPAAGLVVYSYFQTPVIIVKYFIICLPPLAVVVGVVTSALVSRLRWVVVGVIVAASLVGVVQFYADGEVEDWSGATSTVAADVQPGDGILFYAPFGRIPFEWYARDHAAITDDADPVKPATPWGDDLLDSFVYQPLPADVVADAADPFDRVWLVVSSEGTEPGALDEVEQGLADAGFEVAREEHFQGVSVVLYTRA